MCKSSVPQIDFSRERGAADGVVWVWKGGEKVFVVCARPVEGFPVRMEEEKAAAYYDELTRKGGGAARFKQGLGFSSSSSAGGTQPLPSGPAPAASLFGNFIRASSPGVAAEIQKQARLESIQNKLKKKPATPQPSTSGGDDDAERSHRTRARSGRARSRSRSRSRSRERSGSLTGRHSHGRRRVEDGEGSNRSRRRRSRSRSGSEERGISRQSRRADDREDASSRRAKGSETAPTSATSSRWLDRGHRDSRAERKDRPNDSSKNRNARTDYSQLINDYSQMVGLISFGELLCKSLLLFKWNISCHYWSSPRKYFLISLMPCRNAHSY